MPGFALATCRDLPLSRVWAPGKTESQKANSFIPEAQKELAPKKSLASVRLNKTFLLSDQVTTAPDCLAHLLAMPSYNSQSTPVA